MLVVYFHDNLLPDLKLGEMFNSVISGGVSRGTTVSLISQQIYSSPF